jgi:lysozyme-like protein
MLVPMPMIGPGLGASCAPMSYSQVYDTARGAGFPPDVAVQMTAIAFRESSGCPTAHNPGTLGVREDSYGLWQINVLANPTVLTRLGLSSPTQLYDPATNAAAAYLIWGGNPQNLNTAWAINKTGPPYYYAEKYQANLPQAQAAANLIEASNSSPPAAGPADTSTTIPDGSDTMPQVSPQVVTVAGFLGDLTPVEIGVGAGLAALLLIASIRGFG